MYRENDKRMGLLSYIKGERKGRKAHDIEREAMRDAFLSEALDGYDNTDDPNLGSRLSRMESNIQRRCAPRRGGWRAVGGMVYLIAAASVVLCIVAAFLVYETGKWQTGVIAFNSPSAAIEEDAVMPSFVDAVAEAEAAVCEIPETEAEAVQETLLAEAAEVKVQHKEMLSVERQSTARYAGRAMARADRAEHETRQADMAVAEAPTADSAAPMLDSATPIPDNAAPIPDSEAPIPAAGYKAYYEYIYGELAALPGDALKGRVVLRFGIDEQRRPHDIVVVESNSDELAEAVKRLIATGPDWERSGEVKEFKIEL